jgi:hypothetical protein
MKWFSRKEFVALLPIVPTMLTRSMRPAAPRAADVHPDPRPGIDASRVTPREHVEHGAAEFDMVREIPQVIDGIRCQCGCADVPDHYSLLSCYEGRGMAQHCEVCRRQVRLAHRLQARGHTLDEIRARIDEEFATGQ